MFQFNSYLDGLCSRRYLHVLAGGFEGHPEDHRGAPMKVQCALREVVMRNVVINFRILGFFILVGVSSSRAVAGDWPEWRGPSRDGT
jgi:hypothetical protein